MTECTLCGRHVRDERMYHDAAGSGAVWCCDCFWGGILPADTRGVPTVAGR